MHASRSHPLRIHRVKAGSQQCNTQVIDSVVERPILMQDEARHKKKTLEAYRQYAQADQEAAMQHVHHYESELEKLQRKLQKQLQAEKADQMWLEENEMGAALPEAPLSPIKRCERKPAMLKLLETHLTSAHLTTYAHPAGAQDGKCRAATQRRLCQLAAHRSLPGEAHQSLQGEA